MPFRIQVIDGTTYDIRHPDMAAASVTAVAMASATGGDPDHPDQLDLVGIEQIVKVTPIPAVAKRSA